MAPCNFVRTGLQVRDHRLLIDDEMICRQKNHQSVFRARVCLDDSRRERNAWRSVPGARFPDDMLFRKLRQERPDMIDISFIRDNENLLRRNQSLKAENGLFNQRRVAEELFQLFRVRGAAFRPEPFPVTACHDDSINVFPHHNPFSGNSFARNSASACLQSGMGARPLRRSIIFSRREFAGRGAGRGKSAVEQGRTF